VTDGEYNEGPMAIKNRKLVLREGSTGLAGDSMPVRVLYFSFLLLSISYVRGNIYNEQKL